MNLPPQNLEAEESVLAACFVSPSAMLEASDIIRPDHFYRTAHMHIFEAMLDLQNDHEPVDLVTVMTRLTEKKKLEVCGGGSYLSMIIDNCPMAVNVSNYCAIVKACAVKRQLIESCYNIIKNCQDSPNGVVEILDSAQKKITGIDFDIKANVRSLKDLVLDAGERYEAAYKSDSKLTGIETGYSYLDFLTSGWQPGNLIVIAGRPSMGKSALALCLADSASRAGHPALIFSLEMPAEEYCDRAHAKCSGVNSQKFRSGRFEKDDWSSIADASTELYQRQIYIDDTSGVDHNYIRRITRQYKQRHGIEIVFVDHLQLMRGEKSSTRDIEIGSITRALKGMAKELKIPVVLLSQLNRSLELRNGDHKRPKLSDLRESGNIEQDADIVGFLYRAAVYNDKLSDEDKNIAEFNIAKQRNGPTGMVKLFWNARITTFFDLKQEA